MKIKLYYLIGLIFCIIPAYALADAGLPMIFVTMPAMLVSLLPVIGIEAYILNKYLSIGTKKSLISSSIANAISTLVGIPLTWVLLVFLEIKAARINIDGLNITLQKFLSVTLQSPWLGTSENDLGWMVPSAMLFLLIPFFFVSWLTEFFIIAKMNKNISVLLVRKICFLANLISYMFLTLYPIWLYIRYFIR